MPQLKRAARSSCRMPIATNTVVVNFEQLAANIQHGAVDVDPARHDVLGRHPAVHQGGGRLRDDRARRRRAQLGRARHPARDDAAPGRGRAEPRLRGRRALPSPGRRRHRRRPDALRERRDPRARRAGARRRRSTATSSRGITSCSASWAAIRTTATRGVRAGIAHVPNRDWADPATSVRRGLGADVAHVSEENRNEWTTCRKDGAGDGRRPGHRLRRRDADGAEGATVYATDVNPKLLDNFKGVANVIARRLDVLDDAAVRR